MFANVEERALFPSFVWIHDVEPAVAEPLNAKLFQDLDEITKPRPKLSRGHNWQTEQVLHELPQFQGLVEIIMAASKGVLDAMAVAYERFEITGCWANISPAGAPHPPHFHANNFLSGVYYVQTQPGADRITFHEPRPQLDIIAPRTKKPTKYTAMIQEVQAKPGRLVIFPAWLTHSVPTNESQNLRISISFNIMFSDFTATMGRPRWSGIPVRRDTGPEPSES